MIRVRYYNKYKYYHYNNNNVVMKTMTNIRSISSSSTTTTTTTTTTTNNNNRRYPFTSIGFSGAGFLGAYHCGVSSCLLKHHYLLQPMERIITTTTTTTTNNNSTTNNSTTNNKVLYPPILTGVSAGSIISSAISIGVSTNDAMDVLYEINTRTNTKSNIIFNSLTPGFSLVDQVEDLLYNSFRLALGGSSIDMTVDSNSGGGSGSYEDYDNELLMNRISHGSLLHIGLSDKRKMKQYIQSNLLRNNNNNNNNNNNIYQQEQNQYQQEQYQNPMNVIKNIKGNRNLYVYVNQYRNLKDIVSACILSSYIPIGTGPLRTGNNSNSNNNNKNENDNGAVRRAFETMKEMEYLGFVKDSITGEPIIQKHHDIRKEEDDDEEEDDEKEEEESYFLDGGLVNMFPSIDQSTLMVTPLHCIFSNNPYIAPKAMSENNRYVDFDDEVSIGMNMQNMKAAMKMLRSSDPSYLDEKFCEGYDDATRFLKERNLLTVFTL